jgi:uncharacterized protein with PIN domain
LLIYADSSAVVAWLLDQDEATSVGRALSGATRVACSALTLFECERVVLRGLATGALAGRDRDRLLSTLDGVTRTWTVAPITSETFAEGRRTFPREPVRALDAIHLATALQIRCELPGLAVLTTDARFAENASALGFPVLPGPSR